MNNIEAIRSNSASPFEKSQGKPAAPIGLEFSGPKRNFFISKLHDWKLQSAVSAVLFVSAACGGGADAKASSNGAEKPQPPAAAVNLTSELTATATPEATRAAIVVPTEVVKGAIPEDAQKILNDFSSISSFKPEENEAIAKDFTDIWSNAKTDFQKYGAYSRIYGILWAKYNITKDPAVLAEMNKVEQTISQNWPKLYETDASNNGFYRDLGK